MASLFISNIKQTLGNLERTLRILFYQQFPPVNFHELRIANNAECLNERLAAPSLEQLMQDGILWGVPKSRRTIEKRLQRKFGIPKWHWKPLVPRTNLLNCNTCGNTYEAGHLCTHCYNKVMDETKKVQDAVQAELGLEPVEKEVVVLYRGEREQQPNEFWEGKRIVELDRERPSWFSKNLLQKSTQAPATSTDIKPTELA
ncbi:39S ribosomal protein L32, mitochondrial [Nilaparvata lugens]|uniref:39S ribosomal protein L32, mitochondrial n=1 Tax=Nilaparvata lugens TaxID=108931 RepID=UPI000B98FA89|nr:39S ribosomal protein L32, mitochondrial [Nilaparvata lugens]